MVPTQQAEQKEKNSILEQVERARTRDPLKRKSDALLQQLQSQGSHRDLLAALETPVFDSKRLRLPEGRKISSPESPVEQGQELPNHKVDAKMFSLCEHFMCICSRFWWIVS